MMEYKGYIGKVEFDEDAGVIHGEVINTRDVITFQGDTVAEVKKAFHESVDDYLEFCISRGESPDKPFSGQFVTRISPGLHRQIHLAATLSGQSLNAWVTKQLEGAVLSSGAVKETAVEKPPARTDKHKPQAKSRGSVRRDSKPKF